MFLNCDAYVLLSPTNRFYYTKLQTSAGCVILTRDQSFFMTDFRYIELAQKNLTDFTVEMITGKLFDEIGQKLNKLGITKIGIEEDFLNVSMYKRLRECCPNAEFVNISREIAMLRAIKTEDEISKIANAQVIAQKALSKVVSTLKPGITEREVMAELLYEMQMLGASGCSFDTIVAFKENSAMPHHATSGRKLEKNDIILIDMGAKVNGYCSDMTRTFAIGDVGKQLEDIHALVLEGQTMALKQIKAGMTGREADAIAREFFKANGFEKEFGHSLGHGVGIDVHEFPAVSASSEDILQPNMVITVEPGLYLEGIGGVRIEDMIVVKEGGNVNLTKMDKSLY